MNTARRWLRSGRGARPRCGPPAGSPPSGGVCPVSAQTARPGERQGAVNECASGSGPGSLTSGTHVWRPRRSRGCGPWLLWRWWLGRPRGCRTAVPGCSGATPGYGILLPDRFPEQEAWISSHKFIGSGCGQGVWWCSRQRLVFHLRFLFRRLELSQIGQAALTPPWSKALAGESKSTPMNKPPRWGLVMAV